MVVTPWLPLWYLSSMKLSSGVPFMAVTESHVAFVTRRTYEGT